MNIFEEYSSRIGESSGVGHWDQLGVWSTHQLLHVGRAGIHVGRNTHPRGHGGSGGGGGSQGVTIVFCRDAGLK